MQQLDAQEEKETPWHIGIDLHSYLFYHWLTIQRHWIDARMADCQGVLRRCFGSLASPSPTDEY